MTGLLGGVRTVHARTVHARTARARPSGPRMVVVGYGRHPARRSVGIFGREADSVMAAMAARNQVSGRGVIVVDAHGGLASKMRLMTPSPDGTTYVVFPSWAGSPHDRPRTGGYSDLLAPYLSDLWGPHHALILENLAGLVVNSTKPYSYDEIMGVTVDGAARERMADACPDIEVRKFWEIIYPAILGSGEPVSKPVQTRTPVRNAMTDGGILVVDVGSAGPRLGGFLGSLLLRCIVIENDRMAGNGILHGVDSNIYINGVSGLDGKAVHSTCVNWRGKGMVIGAGSAEEFESYTGSDIWSFLESYTGNAPHREIAGEIERAMIDVSFPPAGPGMRVAIPEGVRHS